MKSRFDKSFTQQEPIPEAAIAAAVEVMRSGRLHRYNIEPGELGATAQLEADFARYTTTKFCLACASGGYALAIAMRAAGVQPGDRVLCNGFTLAPVPGAIHNVGAVPVWVEINQNLVPDLAHIEDLARTTGARYLLLSHMRGHSPDMSDLSELCERLDICLIEDCAHTMGARWNGRMSGTFGRIGCFSTQTYKHINSGEGGLIISNDADVMAKAILLSGSYMLFDRHEAAPDPTLVNDFIYTVPNYSGRMDNLRASILIPQLAVLDASIERWNERYQLLEQRLATAPEVQLPVRPAAERYVGSSIQFRLPDWSAHGIRHLVERCRERGVELKWFGAESPVGYTSRYEDWRYFQPKRQAGDGEPTLPRTAEILSTLLDMRIPLTFTLDDCRLIGSILVEEITALAPSLDEFEDYE